MAELGKFYNIQLADQSASGKVYKVRDVSGEKNVSGKIYQVKGLGGGTTINNQDITITENGTYTADEGYTGLGTVEVQVPNPSTGTLSIVENGSYDVTEYATAEVNVPTGGGGGSSDEWQPNPNWWDIRKILDEDTRPYAGKVGVILYNFNDVSDFQLSSSGMTAVATSDGAFYSYADNGANVSHNWDTTQDKDDGRGIKTRWVIYYYTTGETSDTFKRADAKFGWAYNSIAYLVLRINCSKCDYFCDTQHLLEAIDNVGYSISGTNFSNFCSSCYVLTKLPDGLDTSSGTNFSNFCSSCHVLTTTPEITMAANTTAITSKYSGPFNGATWLKTVLLTLPSNTNFWLDTSTRISIESFRYIADHAPDVTATPRTLTVGSTNITRINAADPTIITDLNAKGWTVA